MNKSDIGLIGLAVMDKTCIEYRKEMDTIFRYITEPLKNRRILNTAKNKDKIKGVFSLKDMTSLKNHQDFLW